jgi:hypothetical protein
VTDAELDTLLGFYDRAHPRGFDAGIQAAIERMLVSFNFIFRVEHDPPRHHSRRRLGLSDLDLASRLSFFVWSSIPDEELLDLAERGELSNARCWNSRWPACCRPALEALVESFAASGSACAKRNSAAGSERVFPEFDENLRARSCGESLFLESQLREDRSVVDIWAPTTRSSTSGSRSITGWPGSRRALPQGDVHRRHARWTARSGRVLMVTSYPDRTAPVLRGVWVLENLLGMPPPPPPPNVPDLETTAPRMGACSRCASRWKCIVRTRRARCVTCAWIRWASRSRTSTRSAAGARTSGGRPVDASAVFADGTPSTACRGCARSCSAPRQLCAPFAGKLLTYALGRHVDPATSPPSAPSSATPPPGRAAGQPSSLAIVNSPPFQMRKTAS